MLVFLPGAGEIRRVQGMLSRYRQRRRRDAAVRRARARRDQDAALRPAAAGPAQDRARHQHRRNQPHHRWRAHRRRCRARAPQPVRSGERHEPPGSAAHLARLARSNAPAARGVRRPACAIGCGARAPNAVSRPTRRRKSALPILRHWRSISRCGAPKRTRCAGSMHRLPRRLPAPAICCAGSARWMTPDKVTRARPRDAGISRASTSRAHAVEGARAGAGQLAAELAALLSDRDLLRAGGGPRERDSDVRTRLEALRRGAASVDRGALERVRRAQRSFEQQLDARRAPPSREDGAVDAGVLLGMAYPDRIARRRPGAKRATS